MTKPFTATAMMMLQEEGKLHVSDGLAKHFGDLPAAWRSITIAQLLSHTSGIVHTLEAPAAGNAFIARMAAWHLTHATSSLTFQELAAIYGEHLRQLDQQMADLLAAHHDAVQRLAEIPGLGVDSAQQIIAEVGATAATFPSPKLFAKNAMRVRLRRSAASALRRGQEAESGPCDVSNAHCVSGRTSRYQLVEKCGGLHEHREMSAL